MDRKAAIFIFWQTAAFGEWNAASFAAKEFFSAKNDVFYNADLQCIMRVFLLNFLI